MTLINLAESWLPYPQFERLFFSDTENAVVINGKEKKKSSKQENSFYIKKNKENHKKYKVIKITGRNRIFFLIF